MDMPGDLLSYDWESAWKKLQESDPKDGCFYMVTLNKDQPSEYRTRFMTYAEAADLISTALAKKKLRSPITASTESTHS